MNSRWSRGTKRSLVLGGMVGAVGLAPLASQAQPPANVIFLLDNNKSMQDFLIPLPEAFTPGYSPTTGGRAGDRGYNDPNYGHFINTGCTDPVLVAEMRWFYKNSPNPVENGSVVYDRDPNLNSSYFEPGRFYHARGRRISWWASNEDYPASMSADFKYLYGGDASAACQTGLGLFQCLHEQPGPLE